MRIFTLLISLLLSAHLVLAQQSDLATFLASRTEIKEITKLENNDFFQERYQIMVEQALDHSNPEKGTYLQRVFVADKGTNRPMVFITEGYGANYAASKSYVNELSTLLEANQICAEHRYFGESWPEKDDPKYLTVANAAADHHRIVEIFKEYYNGKWINTGISKGGQTALYHRAMYPDDVDVSVGYVCPLNFGLEDGRHEPFLRKIPGTKEQRKKIRAFQKEVLKRRGEILPWLEKYVENENLTFRISMDEVLDYMVLEYDFALWQWGRYVDKVPDADEKTSVLFSHLLKVSGPSYFSIEGMKDIRSFFVQAAHELGYYGYNTRPFRKYLSIKNAENYLEKIFLPEEYDITYKGAASKMVRKFIKKSDAKVLFVYGEFDPWSASAFKVPNRSNYLKVVKPGGSHSTRIGNLPEEVREEVVGVLEEWL